MCLAIEGALDKIEASDSEAEGKVKLLAPLIEEQRAALALLEEDSITTFGDFQAAADEAVKAEDLGVTEAMGRLRGVEEKWRGVLAGLETDANKATAPALQIGDKAPEMDLMSSKGSDVNLEDILAQKPSAVVLVWLRHFG